MEYLTLCKQYLKAINAGSLPLVLSLFESPEAIVRSPVYGQMTAGTYYRILFSDTRDAIIRIRHVYEALSDAPSIALHFSYTCITSNGHTVEYDGVDVFELTKDQTRFTKLTIIYDPTHTGLKPKLIQHSERIGAANLDLPAYNLELKFN
ncbi:hypothetical protein ACFQUU_02445 [Herbaspirillum sp. GCM10030257]|uniref:hypothetical protein n=1 Tax=Herbaspirillum sp. GCM10030257 TaxID=3273393 RepID=UPI003614BB02